MFIYISQSIHMAIEIPVQHLCKCKKMYENKSKGLSFRLYRLAADFTRFTSDIVRKSQNIQMNKDNQIPFTIQNKYCILM